MDNIYIESFSYRFYSRQIRLTMNDRNPSLNVKKLFALEYFEYKKKNSAHKRFFVSDTLSLTNRSILVLL